MNGELALEVIKKGLLAAILDGKNQYTTMIWKGTFDDIEDHLENTGHEYGSWCYLQEWFNNFAIGEGLGEPDIEDLAASGSDKLDLCFTWA
jgi:hypothetical protein